MRSSALPYTIVSCSSQDPSYPIESIQTASIRSSGWQSLPNPIYPISFVVDFGSKVDLETLQFVSHQSKIPAKVDLYFGDQPPKFRLLGSFQFSDNSHTRYSARELKSANLQRVSARFIRVSIASCHNNPNNVNHQVGIVSFKAIGKANPNAPKIQSQNLQNNQLNNLSGSTPQSNRPSTTNYENDLINRIQTLENEKRRAVDAEDFQAAAKYKKEVDSLKSKRDKLVQLQKSKADAIAREDFDAASEFKERIERLINGNDFDDDLYSNSAPSNYQSINASNSPRFNNSTSNQRKQSNNNMNRNQYQEDDRELPTLSKNKPQQQRKQGKPSSRIPEPDEYPQNDDQDDYEEPIQPKPEVQERTRAIVSTNYDSYEDPPIRKTNGADLSEDRPINPAKNLPTDDPDSDDDPNNFHGFKIDNLAGTIPAFKEDESPVCDDPPDELKPGDRQEAQPLINQFGEDPIKRFFSKPWALRLQGIHMLQDLISGLAADYVPLFHNFCYILRHRVQELQKQVVLASLNAVQAIADTHQIEPPELTKAVSQFLNHAVAKIGGSQKAVTEGVCQFLIWLSKKRALDLVLPIVMAPVKNAAQWKAQLSRINTLHELLFAHGIDSCPGLSTLEVMGSILPALESPKKEVRDAVIEMLVTIETCIGSMINKYIDGLPTRTRKEVQKAIEDHRQQEEY
ncbi:UvrB/uvrC motif family protein [Tritrichomonas foetus]|uniref:UvrB/uvrC motif family protein n=1 Tax=Tritrichomonas foetus TaxID=1144522 RepID=A0A1J4KP62_9EUKA|nr:UvrB/uvrC motif family protein [Tritrichomonas foetus]|eukprot:OHT12890.1 UvrB/uvrC motif family protein [Tritrichomonas foetus]